MKTNPRAIRALGALLIALGVLLCGSMAWLIHFLQQAIAQTSNHRWNGSPEFTGATFSLFYSIFAFGAVSLGSGIFQLRTARRSRVIAIATLVALGPILYYVSQIMSLKK